MLKLKVHSIKTDNTNINKKIQLRKQATSNLKKLHVLDLFAGNNILWSEIKTDSYFGVDKNKRKGKNLTADNIRIIPSLDLSRFNVIDVDSYGIPFNQIYHIFKNKTLQNGTVIIFTCISNKMSSLNKKCLEVFNLNKIYKKTKVLINAKAHELFYAYLYINGIKYIYKYSDNSTFKKDYGYFIIDKC